MRQRRIGSDVKKITKRKDGDKKKERNSAIRGWKFLEKCQKVCLPFPSAKVLLAGDVILTLYLLTLID